MKQYECKFFKWDKWTHYGMAMPFGVCTKDGKDCKRVCSLAIKKSKEKGRED